MLVKTHGETEVGPVVSEFQALEGVTLKFHLAIEVLLIENLHGNLALAPVSGTVMVTVELKVVFHRAASVLGFFGLAGRNRRSHGPENHQNRDCREDGEENSSVETSTHLASKVPGDYKEEGEKESIGEAVASSRVRWNRGILDGRILQRNKSNSISAPEAINHGYEKPTDVVRTPQSSALVVEGPGGVSMNSNSSGDSGWIFVIIKDECQGRRERE